LLKIRLTRTGKKNRPSYRIVVAEHTAPIQGKFAEVLGFYNPIENPKQLEYKEDRIKYWISVGAQPTDTVASLLKSAGVEGMDQYIAPKDKKRPKKNPGEETEAPAEEPSKEEAPVEEAEAKEEMPAEEVADEPATETEEEVPAEDEEATSEESKEEEKTEEAEAEEATEEKPEGTPAEKEKAE